MAQIESLNDASSAINKRSRVWIRSPMEYACSVLCLVSFLESLPQCPNEGSKITQPLHLLADPETGNSAFLQNVIHVLARHAIADRALSLCRMLSKHTFLSLPPLLQRGGRTDGRRPTPHKNASLTNSAFCSVVRYGRARPDFANLSLSPSPLSSFSLLLHRKLASRGRSSYRVALNLG